MGDASLPQDPNIGMDAQAGGDTMMGGEPNAMDSDPNMGGEDPNAMGDNMMGGDPNAMGDEPMGEDPNAMGDEPMSDEPMDGENPEGDGDEKVEYGTSIFKGLTSDNQDAAIAYMKSMEDREDNNADMGNGSDVPENGGLPQDDGQGGGEQGAPLMEVVFTKKQVKKISENLMQQDTENNDRDEREPLDKKQSKGNSKSPFNAPKFN